MTEVWVRKGHLYPSKEERGAHNREQRWQAKLANYRMMAKAIELLERAGFVFDHESPFSESRYYYWPGREDYHLRVSCHPPRSAARLKPRGRTIAFLTFNGGAVPKIEAETMKGLLHSAIGRYMVDSGS